jgi:hypothetical protein
MPETRVQLDPLQDQELTWRQIVAKLTVLDEYRIEDICQFPLDIESSWSGMP